MTAKAWMPATSAGMTKDKRKTGAL